MYTVDLKHFGYIIIDEYKETMTLELYHEKITGTFSKKRVRGKLAFKKQLNFSQLINYNIIKDHQTYRSHADFEKMTGIRNGSELRLEIELFIDAPQQNYYRHSFGTYHSFYPSFPKEADEAQEIMGRLVSVLEKIKRHRTNTQSCQHLPEKETPFHHTENRHRTPNNETVIFEVILESAKGTTTKQTTELIKLIKEKNEKAGFFKISEILGSKNYVLFTTSNIDEAEDYANRINKVGAIATVVNSPLQTMRNNNKNINLSDFKNPATTIAFVKNQIQNIKDSENKPSLGCLIVFILFCIAMGVIGSINSPQKNESSPPSTVAEPHPKADTSVSDKSNDTATPSIAVTQTTTIASASPANFNAEVTTPQQYATPPHTPSKPTKSIKEKIAKNAISAYPTKKGQGYDKTIDRYGVSRIKKANKLMPLVAEKAASMSFIEEVSTVELSDNYSTEKKLVFFVDDYVKGIRLYIDEDMKIVDTKTIPKL